MLQSQLKILGVITNKIKYIFIALAIINLLFLQVEKASFSEKIVAGALSLLYILMSFKSTEMTKEVVLLMVTVIVFYNVFLFKIDIEYFMRQAFGSFSELVVLGYYLKKYIDVEQKIDRIEFV
ncbi:hypothetical protein [Flammeovirga kamogawensis]|uniref:Uncharacterized protein n=1 Tax=Flammeovirga kamogawensis TaxID=373891 RepID=A0ABX8GU04_9BACT|nr:hypothetical protein [Flammeovirga kamogawensis]MBB6459911.1 hypothetical protein [Flammeovirga kamogawensis]QWG07036.1 hypothetical protein KM029_17300 [Flammeovirga kamogawensis]TRX68857.1 hypothetical protein EO216_12285 [Flammeovirga kamogawensis]